MRDYPLIKVVIIFICGIIFNNFLNFNSSLYLIISICIALLILLLQLKFKESNLVSALLLIFLTSTIFFFGSFLSKHENNKRLFIPDSIYKIKKAEFYGSINRIDLKSGNEIRFLLKVDSLSKNNIAIYENLKVICKIKDRKNKIDSLYGSLDLGMMISIKGNYYRGREKRNPGEFDYNKYLHSKGISGNVYCYHINDLKIINSNYNLFKSIIFKVRKSINDEIQKLYRDKSAALLKGLLLADKSNISYQTKTDFINSGVIHVLAVSGLHVGYIILIILIAFGRFNIYIRSILLIIGLLFFLLITGAPASVFRASLMAVIIIIAMLTNRSTNLINSLAFAALIILIINPLDIFNPGFQLSFAAVLSIAIIYPIILSELNKLNIKSNFINYVLLFAGVSLSAQIGTLPFTLYYFGKLSLVALGANLVVIPLIGIIVALGIISISTGLIFPLVGHYYAVTNEFLVLLLYKFTSFSGELNYSYLKINNFSIYDSIVFYLFLFTALIFYKYFKTLKTKLLLLLLISCNILFYINTDYITLLPNNELSLMMIDVGQGDSFLIKFPNNKTALVDAGNVTPGFDNGEKVIIPLLNYLNINEINYGFVSHMDLDHYGGFISLVHAGMIDTIYKPKIDSSLEKDVRFEKYLHKNNIPIKYYKQKVIKIGNSDIFILNNSKIKKHLNTTTNDRGGILKLVYGKTSILFTGDVQKEAEKYYTKFYGKFLNTNVLKVAHHGSKTSSSINFLNYALPKISLVSVGIDNRFGHPSKMIIKRLEEYKTKIYRTDKLGAVLLQSQGDSISVVNWRNKNN